MRIYLQRQRFFFWKGWGSAGLPECAGLAELLEEVAYFSRFQENGLTWCAPFFGLFFRSFSFWLYVLSSVFCLLESFFSFYICVFLSAFFPLILIILPLGPFCFLSFFSSLLLTFSPPPTPVYLYFPLGSFLPLCHLHCFPFVCFFVLSLFFRFLLFPSLLLFCLSLLSSSLFFSCFFSLISLLTFLYPLSRPSQFSIVLLQSLHGACPQLPAAGACPWRGGLAGRS